MLELVQQLADALSDWAPGGQPEHKDSTLVARARRLAGASVTLPARYQPVMADGELQLVGEKTERPLLFDSVTESELVTRLQPLRVYYVTITLTEQAPNAR